ncbi:MAG: DNA repair protein RecO [Snowella sp.]|nr:DNA repair protein RecO [Snowella sp.]
MSQVYKATGIILKGMPFGEADRLLTILSPEVGLFRAIAPNARKPKSLLRGRCELFVVNEFLISKGRSLDKIAQIDTLESYPQLSRNIGTLAAAQYLAEIVLCLAADDEPQTELFALLNEHLHRLESLNSEQSLHAHVAHAVFHLLALAGYAPQVHYCCLTNTNLVADYGDPQWQVAFSVEMGGLIKLGGNRSLKRGVQLNLPKKTHTRNGNAPGAKPHQIQALEVTLLQQLSGNTLPKPDTILPPMALKSFREANWVNVEHLLRAYAQFHLGKTFRSAELVDSLLTLDF